MGLEIYEINPDKCTECVGHYDAPQCRQVCPVDCIPLHPQYTESQEQLMAKYKLLTASKKANAV
jgi:ferredoxin